LSSNCGPKKGLTLVQTTSSETSALATKLESLEEHQALEKDCLDVMNKQWSAKLESIEGLVKTLLSQAHEKPSLSFVQNIGMGNCSNHMEAPGRVITNFSSKTDYICFECGESCHFQNNCKHVKALIAKEAIIYNHDGRVCLPDGS
jgi:hypothetical protein